MVSESLGCTAQEEREGGIKGVCRKIYREKSERDRGGVEMIVIWEVN